MHTYDNYPPNSILLKAKLGKQENAIVSYKNEVSQLRYCLPQTPLQKH